MKKIATSAILLLGGLLGLNLPTSAADGRFVNLSARALVETGEEVMIGGFIIEDGARQVLIQALGPELADRGISNALADPVLTVTASDGTELMVNDNWEDSQGQLVIDLWGGSPNLTAGSLSSAAVLTLLPGNYTAKVEGKNGATGVAIVEVYEIDSPDTGNPDRTVLIALYNAMDGANWTNNANWLSDAPLDEWHGVGLDDQGRVTRLDLSANNLRGPIPPELGNLANLQFLWLNNNQLNGPIPAELGNLSNLLYLVLNNNQLSGPIPAELGNLTNLIALEFRDNLLLWGPLPLSLTNLSLGHFGYSNTNLCVPADETLRAWLAAIPNHDGTGTSCAPRDILVALYNATDGPNWTNNTNWGTTAPLGEWYGVSVDSLGRVTGLDLNSNGLKGRLPSILSGLTRMTELRIGDNPGLWGLMPVSLSGLTLTTLDYDGTDLCVSGNESFREWLRAIPSREGTDAECAPLSDPRKILTVLYETTNGPGWTNSDGQVVSLTLGENNLSGPIPPEIGNLTNLTILNLRINTLTGAIPPELGDLTSLTFLDLSSNGLTGAIPAELGNLTYLSFLDLGINTLLGAIPPELGYLTNMRTLNLRINALTGAIPAEFGGLSRLESLLLQINNLQGAVPPEMGGLANLRQLGLARNERMSGAFPLSLTALSRLEVFVAQGTDLCAPSEADFLNWLDGIPVQRVARCESGRAMAYLTQAVQSREFPVPLVAGEEAFLRVFVTATRSNDLEIPPVRATFYRNEAQSHVVNIAGRSGPVPTEVREGVLETSSNARIPGQFVQPGLELVIEVDPDGTLDPALGIPQRIPETGRLAIEVRTMPLFDLTVIPFLWTESSDSSILDITRGLTADSELLFEARTLLPVADFDVTVHAPVSSSSNNAYDLFGETIAIRTMEGGSGHYMGALADPVGTGGLAATPGRVSFAEPTGWVMAHELGHNMSLLHPWINPFFPSFPEGRIGSWGYDFRDGGRLVPPQVDDIMSGPGWISDFHFTQALRFRRRDMDGDGAVKVAEATPSLLLWGGVKSAGAPFLEPAFVVEAPPELPDSVGDYQITGLAEGGRELFSLSFDMPDMAEGDGRSSFAFALPTRAEWAAALASITLTGPGGSATFDGNSNRPMKILRNPRTGQVRGILRNSPLEAAVAVDNMATVPADDEAADFEVLFSRGIPDAAAW